MNQYSVVFNISKELLESNIEDCWNNGGGSIQTPPPLSTRGFTCHHYSIPNYY